MEALDVYFQLLIVYAILSAIIVKITRTALIKDIDVEVRHYLLRFSTKAIFHCRLDV